MRDWKKEKIVAAAILHGDVVYTFPPPARHHTILHWMSQNVPGFKQDGNTQQGFITDAEGELIDRWVRRAPARMIAINAGQLTEEKASHARELFSEDLW